MDITSTGLGNFIIHGLANSLRKSRSILSIHLTGNPGMNPENYEFLVNRIKCRPNENIVRYQRIKSFVAEMTKDFPAQYH